MDVLLGFLLVAGVGAVIMWGLLRLARRARRRGITGAMVSAIDEIYHPIAYDSHLEVQVQIERKAPPPSPGDPPL